MTCRYRWHVEPSETPSTGEVLVEPGTKQLVPIRFPMPATHTGDHRAGDAAIVASFDFGDDNVQSDTFALDAVQPVNGRPQQSNIAVFDPKGLTVALLEKLGTGFKQIDAEADLSPYDVLVLGREAVSPNGRLPNLAPVKNGLKVLVFEQTAEALSDRLGFRINVHGMRTAFARTPSHPALAGLNPQQWHDWRGAATLTPPCLDVPDAETHDPTWVWCGFENTRVWRCGNNGNVASVLIEKPSRGSFLPILDCGFDLQYSPLLEYREGLGRILFCQLDVTGRTAADPAAERIVRNLLAYVESVPHAESRVVFYTGNGQAKQLLEQLGVSFQQLGEQDLDSSALLVLGPEAKPMDGLLTAVENGANLLCLGLSQEELQRLLADRVSATTKKVIPSLIRSFDEPAWQGISNADLHWRTAQLELAALAAPGEQSNETLQAITIGKGKVVICQAAPWMFDYEKQPYLRTTYRRNVFLVSRLLANLGASCRSPLLEMFRNGEPKSAPWLHSYYVQQPQAVDDPYRYYRW